jgi:hypothetical protein
VVGGRKEGLPSETSQAGASHVLVRDYEYAHAQVIYASSATCPVPRVQCHVSSATCPVSRVQCHVSGLPAGALDPCPLHPCRHRSSNRQVAIKRIKANDLAAANRALEEANQMSRLRHELLVELMRVFLSPLDLGRFQVVSIRRQ